MIYFDAPSDLNKKIIQSIESQDWLYLCQYLCRKHFCRIIDLKAMDNLYTQVPN